MRYEMILEKNNYALIMRKNELDEYAVVYGLNKERGDWAHTVGYYNFSEYSSMDKTRALTCALEIFRERTEENYIVRARLEELATLFKDGLIEDGEDEAMEYFNDTCEMSASEKEWFGIGVGE